MKSYTLLLLLTLQLTPGLSQNGHELPVPQDLSLKQDLPSQTLTLSWKSDSSLFDIEIFRTELMEIVLNETVLVDSVAGTCEWKWHSAVPLECTSHSVHIRARDQHTVSQWSPLETIIGSDLPDMAESQMYPQDKVVPVGSNVTFCCIVREGQKLDSIMYKTKKLKVSRLSRRTFSATVTDLPLSRSTGTNVICFSPSSILTGAVVFVGYPPTDKDLVCETRDLVSAECHWKMERDTGFWKTSLLTNYSLNGRHCEEASKDKRRQACRFERWEGSRTLVAKNPLGTVQLNDSAQLSERVHLLAPLNVSGVPQAWNATLQWMWPFEAYKRLDMICQVQLISEGTTDTRNYTGVGLSALILDTLMPDLEYSVSVRCASLHSFWRWGDWSTPYNIHTLMDRPETPEMWVWMSSETEGRVMWKPLSVRDSHGALTAYEVFHWEEDRWQTLVFLPTVSSYPIALNNNSMRDVIIGIAARNPVGLSERSTMAVPEFQADAELSVPELVGSDRGLELSWQSRPNASRGYVVEWLPTNCTDLCTVQWLKAPKSNTSTTIPSAFMEPGVMYKVSVFALSPEATALMQRHHGYGQELVPVQSVQELLASQSGSDVLLSWSPVETINQRGFIRGYTIYRNDASRLNLIANLTDPTLRSYSVKGLDLGSYKFTVRPYTSAGEGTPSTVFIQMTSNADMLVVEILVALGVMSVCLIFISFFCYKKREWVKKAFYPEIPGPKLTGNWSAPQGPLDVKPPSHSLVHIVESPEWDSGKEGLITLPKNGEDDDSGSANDNVEADTDSDEPALLRYYNQLVSDSSNGLYTSDTSGSSTSSMDSAQTQVTYAGIQSPTFSQEAPAYGYKPQMLSEVEPCDPAPGNEHEPQEESSSVGYKPQCSWPPDSPEAEDFNGSLGSPTSVTSSQFLIPESSEEDAEPSGTWFHSFLSGKF